MSKEFYCEILQIVWHSTMQECIVQKCAKRGRFMLHERLNVDQTPLPFLLDAMKTYELVKPGNYENRTNLGILMPARDSVLSMYTFVIKERKQGWLLSLEVEGKESVKL